mmetsp:Transcript_20572/g.35111  ORF Transcript_20572/g.35111 Transcript_20572/m.35111 type:complete len:226 (-) Transcript_20572:126-803(-)
MPDPDLSPRGFEQATVLGDFLNQNASAFMLGIHPVSELWVSPIKRTMQTVQPIAAQLQLSPRVRLDCFEAGGIYMADRSTYTTFEQRGGLTRQEMVDLFPTYTIPDDVDEAGWYKQPHLAPAHGGRETDAECRARVARVANSIKFEAASLTDDKNVILVAHYDFLCALLDALVGQLPGGPFLAWRHFNTGITVIDVAVDGSVVTLMTNAVPHLVGRPDLVSGFEL